MKRDQIARHEELRALHEIVEGSTNPDIKAQAGEALLTVIGEVKADSHARRIPRGMAVLAVAMSIVVGSIILLLSITLVITGQRHISIPVIVAVVELVLGLVGKRLWKRFVEGG